MIQAFSKSYHTNDHAESGSIGFLSSLIGDGCECDGYSIRIVGHSLGGAIASLLGIRVYFLSTKDYIPFFNFSFISDFFLSFWLIASLQIPEPICICLWTPPVCGFRCGKCMFGICYKVEF